jgi:hypothetical protein
MAAAVRAMGPGAAAEQTLMLMAGSVAKVETPAGEPARKRPQPSPPPRPRQTFTLPALHGGPALVYASESERNGAAKARASETARTLRKEDIVGVFHMTVAEAARQFGLGRTCFKSVCRREGIHEWPRPTRLIRRPNTDRNQKRLRDEAEAADNELSPLSQYIGVFWNRTTKKWQAQITYDMQTIYLGTFTDEEGGEQEAARAFDTAARAKRREPSLDGTDKESRWVLNFPTEEDRRFDISRATAAQQPQRVKQLQQPVKRRKRVPKGETAKKKAEKTAVEKAAAAAVLAGREAAAAAASASPVAQGNDKAGVDALALLADLHSAAATAAEAAAPAPASASRQTPQQPPPRATAEEGEEESDAPTCMMQVTGQHGGEDQAPMDQEEIDRQLAAFGEAAAAAAGVDSSHPNLQLVRNIEL